MIHLLLSLHLPSLCHIRPSFFRFILFERERTPKKSDFTLYRSVIDFWSIILTKWQACNCQVYLVSATKAGSAIDSFNFSIKRRRAFSMFSFLEKLERKNLNREISQIRPSKGTIIITWDRDLLLKSNAPPFQNCPFAFQCLQASPSWTF